MLKRLALAPVLLVLLIICFDWRLVFSKEFTWLEAPGVYERTLPLLQFQAGEVHKLRLPLWDPYTNGGQPLLTWDQPSALYPPHLALLAMPFKSGWLRQSTLHWYFVLIQCAMALAMYAFARSLGQSESASVLAGCIYALGGVAAASQQPHVMHACVWVPLVFRYAFSRDAVRTGLCLGLCWLPGCLEVPLFTTLAVTALSACRARWRDAILTLGLALSIGAIAILPAWQLGGFTSVNYLLHQASSLHWMAWLGLILPGFAPQVYDPYIGAVALSLAVLGFAGNWRSCVEARWLAGIAAVGIITALGASTVLHGVAYGLVPGVSAAQTPAYGSILFHLAIATGAGWGAQLASDLWRKRVAVCLCAIGAIAIFVSAIGWTLRLKFVEGSGTILLPGFLVLALALLLSKGQPRNAATTALILFLADLANGVNPRWISRYDKERPRQLTQLARDFDVVSYLQRARNDLPRVVIDPEAISYNFGPWWGIETYPSPDPNYSTSLWVSRHPTAEFSRLLYKGNHGIDVYGADEATARPRIVHPESCASIGDQAQFSKRLAASIQIDTEAACDGILLTGNRYTPGWRTTVDGKSVRPQASVGGVQGIPVPRGHHQVKAVFQPVGLFLGSVLSALGLATAWALARRRRINYS